METDITAGPESSLWDIQVYPITLGVIIAITIVLILLVCSALISGSEAAYFSLSPADRQKLLHLKNKTNHLVLKNLEHPEKLLATILAANNFVNIGIVILSAYITDNLIRFGNSQVIEFLFQVVLITFVLLLFGEVLPKVYATTHPLLFAKFMAFPLRILEKIFSPVNYILISSTSFVNKRLKKHRKNISMDDLSQALELTSDKELSDEKNILEGIVKFGNKSVAEIMKPRVDVTAIDIRSNFADVLDIIKNSGYSRIPVCSGSFDQIHGILYIKDLLPHAHKGNSFKWQVLIRPPFYVPETKKINSLLEEFQKRKVHLAIVVDEYGGSSGIVTLEDVLEEIVGEITDESDEVETLYSMIAENVFLFHGKVSLNDFCRTMNVDETLFDEVKGDAETLAGLILELKGEIPVLHEKITCKSFQFSIEDVNSRRIEKIKVEVLKSDA